MQTFKRCRSPVAMEALVGVAPPNKAPSPPNWKVKHFKSVEFFSIFIMSSPRTNSKPRRLTAKTPIENFLPTVLRCCIIYYHLQFGKLCQRIYDDKHTLPKRLHHAASNFSTIKLSFNTLIMFAHVDLYVMCVYVLERYHSTKSTNFSWLYYFFIIDKMPSRAGFGPRAVVWRLLL